MADTVFTKVEHRLGSILDSIEAGTLALPDIQRPYVWPNESVRELLDSMYRGFPIGYFLFWRNAHATGTRSIGAEKKQRDPDLLIIDGQQRLTSLYAVIRSRSVLNKDYKLEPIQIAFNPLTETFAVLNETLKDDKSFVPNISVLWSPAIGLFKLSEAYLQNISAVRTLTDYERQKVQSSLLRLQALHDYSLTALELQPTLSDEEVSDIFLRINSEGQRLTTNDFISTLVSVFWDEGRAQLDEFVRRSRNPSRDGSPYNHLIDPKPDQLLRAAVALAFRKTQLPTVYAILRGKDPKTGQFSPQKRNAQFSLLRTAQRKVLNLGHWQDFLKCITMAGYRSTDQITSENTLIFNYVFYLIGRTEFGVPEYDLRKTIAQFFFATIMTGRYVQSDTRMESDLTHLGGQERSPEQFLTALARLRDSMLRDFWQTLPKALADHVPA